MCGKLTVVNALTVNYLYSSYYSSTDTGQKVEERKGYYVLVWKETLIRDAILIKNHMKSIWTIIGCLCFYQLLMTSAISCDSDGISFSTKNN